MVRIVRFSIVEVGPDMASCTFFCDETASQTVLEELAHLTA